MFAQRLIRPVLLGVQSLKLHKLRSSLTILGVVLGVASVIIMLAVGEGAREEAIEAINELGATNIILRSVKPSNLRGGESGGAVRYGLTNRDLVRLSSAIPTLVAIAPTREHRRTMWCADRHLEGRVVGVTPEYQDLNRIRLAQGRFISQLDYQQASKVVVLGARTAEILFPLDNPLGKTMRIGEDQYYVVVGVARPRAASRSVGGGVPSQDFGRDAYIPFSTDQKRFGENIVFDRASSNPIAEKVEISQITVSVRETEQVKPTARVVDTLIRDNHRQEETTMTVPLDLLEKAEQTQRIFTWVLTAIASISLLVGGIGIMNIMLATVTERTREIGIRRALGARRRDIIWQFLIETTVLSCSGGILGIVLGFGGVWAAAHFAGVATLIQPWSPLVAFAISVGVGIIFGVYPARRAAHMNPIQALRHE